MVKCKDCGYLCGRNKDDCSLGELDINYREKGQLPLAREYGRNQYELYDKLPLCFARHPYLGNAIKNINNRDNPVEEVKKIIQTDIDCDKFTEWQQGFTPKEHRDILDRKWMLEFQAQREEDDRKWRDEQRRLDLEWREEQ